MNTTPRVITAILALAFLSLTAFAQEPVRGKLYTKAVGETVHAVVEVRVQTGWHIYHSDLGPPDAFGKPTLLELSGGGLTFGEVEFPEPERHDEPDLGTWTNIGCPVARVRDQVSPSAPDSPVPRWEPIQGGPCASRPHFQGW